MEPRYTVETFGLARLCDAVTGEEIFADDPRHQDIFVRMSEALDLCMVFPSPCEAVSPYLSQYKQLWRLM